MCTNKTTVLFIRHGECSGNLEGMFRGQKDFPLNKRGIEQAREVAQELADQKFKRIYSSPLLRAAQTAEAIGKKLNMPVETCEDINNISLGRWEGRYKDEIASQEPDLWEKWMNNPEELNFPGMEPLEEVMKRSRKALDEMIRINEGSTFAVVTHRTVLKPLFSSCLGIKTPWFWRLHFDTASVSTLSHDQRGYSLISFNRTDHLSEYISEWN